MVVMLNLTNETSPTDILAAFECGAINAIEANFANANVKGYFFHLRSDVWKHVQILDCKFDTWKNQSLSFNYKC